MTTPQVLLSTAFVTGGIVVLSVGVFSVRKTISFLKSCQHAQGTVIKTHRGKHGRGTSAEDSVWAVTLEFRDADGMTRHGIVQFQSCPPQGQMFRLLYDPQSPRFPSEARLSRFQDLWFVPVLCCGLGLICLFVGIAVCLFNIPVVTK